MDELILVRFYEEIDRLVGKNHLFKRSLLLIKAWCTYESRSYAKNSVMNSLTDQSLYALIIHVFNLHHARLHTPLQALSAFFLIFSQFDWDQSAVGLSQVLSIANLSIQGRLCVFCVY